MAEHELGTGQEPFVRWMDESASVMLTIPPASDKIQQPLLSRARRCTFWFIENIQKMLCSLNYPLMQVSARPA